MDRSLDERTHSLVSRHNIGVIQTIHAFGVKLDPDSVYGIFTYIYHTS